MVTTRRRQLALMGCDTVRVQREIIEREGLQGVWFDGTGAACTNRGVDIMNLSVRVT
jgi:hypothetical protein